MTGPRLLQLGVGGLGTCALPLLLRELDVTAAETLCVEAAPDARARGVTSALGVPLRQIRVDRGNYRTLLDEVEPGGLVVDLAYDLDTVDLLLACAERGLRYVNASVELWDPYDASLDRRARTLYARHERLRATVPGWSSGRGPSAALDHGANPGLVSHFTKRALADLAEAWLAGAPPSRRRDAVAGHLAAEDFASLAQALGVRTVHISERDTQVTDRPKRVDEFVNSWSVEGLYEEATAPAELGWGTHERLVPAGALEVGHQLALATSGYQTLVRSWVPYGEIIGHLIRHGEAFSICEHLTVRQSGWDGEAVVYRPTVHYAYCLTDSAMASLHELRMRRGVLQPERRVLFDEITDGADQFGILLGGHDLGAWWYGCVLDVHTARKLQPGSQATLLPVAAGVLAAALWTQREPDAGVHLPDTLPWRQALEDALPWCGPMWSGAVRWSPLRGLHDGPVDPEEFRFEHVLVDDGRP